ncbi:glycosyltransferase family 4 protein [Thermoanaerobacterium sp. R66]|uniref:glycosyltransferase family 4 protein n=1 Tax=Thermoanaerobacterium sp. R66 TaxID=2742479 RepID=UPI0023806D25|nr:glycosyltransferase family 4 protein [Thermoanaerobacterium sp. R66]MDE4541581.1 glycosyltransferase family 4 protein [Thermoanaerobacterium sp. R66]
MEKIRVLHVVREAEGGMKKHLLSILNGLDKDKYQLAVGCSFDKKTTDDLIEDGVSVYRVDICDGINFKKDFAAIKKLRAIIDDFRPHIIHFHGAKASLVGRLASLGYNLKIAVTVHNFPNYKNMNKIKKYFYLTINKYLNKKTDAVVAVSYALKNAIVDEESIPSDKVRIVYNGIDVPQFIKEPLKLREKYDIASDTLIIGCVARLIPSKGVQDLIESLNILRGKVKAFVFIAGDGPYMEHLKDMARDLKLDNVEFLGFIEDIFNFLSSIDIFVLPSHSEGFGISVAEAMALGVPVIATDVGGIPEIVKNDENGIIVKSEAPKDLANAIEVLVLNEDLRNKFSKKGKEYILSNFSKEKMIKELDFLYDELRRK